MLSSVLRSQRAVEVNIAIMRTFVQLRSLMQSNKSWLGLVVPVRRGDILSSPDFITAFSKELGFHTIKSKRTLGI